MIFGSVCSGIEAASSAWHPLGWTPAWYAEIEPFPSAVLAHRHPGIPNHGDFTRLIKDQPASVDVLVGGTPCQSFSVAGLRGGLTDHRGNLALAFMALVDVLRPRWVVWENVPGVLSSNGGRDFGSILGALGKLGYGFAYRILDAQYFGLAQRRKRVFVVGHLGDWRRAAAVLFEPEGVRWDSPPRRETGARAAGSLGTGASGGGGWRVGADEAAAGQVVSVDLQNTPIGGDVAGTVDCSRPGRGGGQAVMEPFNVHGGGANVKQRHAYPAKYARCLDGTGGWAPSQGGTVVAAYGCNDTTGARAVATALNEKGGAGRMDFESETFVAHTLRGTGHDASEDGTGRGVPLVPITFEPRYYADRPRMGGTPQDLPSLRADASKRGDSSPVVAYQCHGSNVGEMGTLRTGSGSVTGGHAKSHANGGVYPAVTSPTMGVRRLTPREMERLQGFPDDYTAIPWRGKPASECPDGPRAKALGNSMAVPVMRWIGQRIALVDGER